MALAAECCYAEWHSSWLSQVSSLCWVSLVMLNVVMLNAIMLSVVMLNVIMLSVILLSVVAAQIILILMVQIQPRHEQRENFKKTNICTYFSKKDPITFIEFMKVQKVRLTLIRLSNNLRHQWKDIFHRNKWYSLVQCTLVWFSNHQCRKIFYFKSQ